MEKFRYRPDGASLGMPSSLASPLLLYISPLPSSFLGILLDLLDNHFELPKLFSDKIEASKCGRRSDLVEPKVICKEIVESGEMLERGKCVWPRP